jgi:Mg2+/citrate symporter
MSDNRDMAIDEILAKNDEARLAKIAEEQAREKALKDIEDAKKDENRKVYRKELKQLNKSLLLVEIMVTLSDSDMMTGLLVELKKRVKKAVDTLETKGG